MSRDAALVFLGGGAGACLRVLLTTTFPTLESGQMEPGEATLSLLPLTTLCINCAGAFALGLLLAYLAALGASTWRGVRMLLGTGLLGGFTTYSAFALQSVQLAAGGYWGVAVSYLLLSLLGGLVLALAGLKTGQLLGSFRARERG